MKFSEKWLREWVNPDISTQQLADQITMAGLEVDGVEPVAGEFSGVVVGEVVECGQHPDADKLQVTKINVGDDELIDIVCGAPNCRQGLKVAVAKVGAVLPGNFKIKKAKLRGQPSFGMLCSFSELGISDDHDGIVELPADAPIGQDIREYLDLNDVTIEVDLTPNRADCLGMRGLAREVGVLNQSNVDMPVYPETAASVADTRGISLAAPQACPRYLGRVIKGIDVNAPSPLWLQEKLRRSGVRSIDAVVDVTNFVLLELGHPMHAFDNDMLSGDIVVRMAKQDEELVLLDETKVTLKDNTLVIADQDKALAMAGIFGGLDSGVTSNSKNIFLESAFFAPDAIMGKARQYGLHTDASHRYERGVDPQMQRQAMERATALLLEIVGGEAGPIVEAIDEQYIPPVKDVVLRAARLTRVLGIEIEASVVSDILMRLGLDADESNGQWQVKVPAYRFDIAIEEDLIEEIARVYGYNNIPNVAPSAELRMSGRKEQALDVNELKLTLTNRDYQEAITYSFVDPKVQSKLYPEIDAIVLPHPISADMSAMRVSAWTGLLQAVSYNQKRQQARVRLFESGLRFIPDASEKMGVRQETVFSGVIAGNLHDANWDRADKAVDFFDAKADVEALLSLIAPIDVFRFEATEHSALHPGQSAAIYRDDVFIGVMGAVHPKFEKLLGLNGRVFVFELEIAAFGEKKLPEAKEISKFPANRRDIAIVVDDDKVVGEILDCIQKFGANQLVGLNLFDIYRGKGIEPGFKSLAISLTLQDMARTLEEAEIQAVVDGILTKLSEQFGATLRD
ncbi:phenylalanyl-tRNA synthetase beta subunit [Paraglaciecola sp. T6c]|uniref:phenylalanine--tRNA ligase subunit beta n=1 Tax=Pseudoalteromonas atlantica (strain T6c / ATCC BAA-1087) TaxID=3042615 RepID=UPI00005C6D7B|nr:phenylalanine--tRNA ligase subunit beta [Paraglaciecola sp. T6c]ABG41010.1 phenylalanyl-tRNA synthetase beta subunit [Paraglaciecola sp. T6c]